MISNLKEGNALFNVLSDSNDSFNVSDALAFLDNGNVFAVINGFNDTNYLIDVPSIKIQNNDFRAINSQVVGEAVTIVKLLADSEALAITNEISIKDNNIVQGMKVFDFDVSSVHSGTDVLVPSDKTISFRSETQIIYQNMTTTAVDTANDGRVGKYFYITLKDKDNNLLANKPVQIGFNGQVYDRVTDENGSARLQINLKNAGTYTFAVSYLGDDVYNGSFIVAKIVVSKQKGSLTVPNKSYKASASSKTLTATFKSASGKVVANKKITFTVNGKSYSATTNAKGVATVKVSLNTKGTYSFTAKFAGNNMYAAMNKTAKLTIS
jgi:hypothetical protein